jgi:integration host factor subunit beta
MKKSELINVLKEKTAISKKHAEDVMDIFFNNITDTLAKGERVEIRGFGSFKVKQYNTYLGRNPKTGKQITVPSKKLPFFKVGKELKNRVDN